MSVGAAYCAEKSFATSEIIITSISQENILAISVQPFIHAAIRYSCTPDQNIPNFAYKTKALLDNSTTTTVIGPESNQKLVKSNLVEKRTRKEKL